jgi:membrane fusion protein (multidrug efflux system)
LKKTIVGGNFRVESTENENDIKPQVEPVRRKRTAKTWLLRSAVAAVLIAACIYFAPKILYSLSHESTDDAYVSGTIVPISAEVKGKVTQVFIEDNQVVKAGAPLLEIYSEDYSNAVNERKEHGLTLMAEKKEIEATIKEKEMSLSQARANLEAAKAEEALAAREVKRYEGLLKEVSRSQVDSVETRWAVAQARSNTALAAVAESEAALETLNAKLETPNSRIKEAETSLSTAKLDLRRTLVAAPISGRIAKKNVDPGKYVQAGQQLLTVVDEKGIWIVANFKETQIKEMRIGQPVEISVDSYPGTLLSQG